MALLLAAVGPVWRDVFCRRAGQPRAWAAHGSWRRRGRSVSSGHFARLEIHCRRRPLRRDCGAGIDAMIRNAAQLCQSERSAGLRIGGGSEDDHLSRSLSSACLAGYAHRSSPSVRRLILTGARYYRQLSCGLLSYGLLSARSRDRWHPKGIVAWYRQTIHPRWVPINASAGLVLKNATGSRPQAPTPA